MVEIVLSIHDRHCENILNGNKTVEIRKTYPKKFDTEEALDGCIVYLYNTKKKCIVGEFDFTHMYEFLKNPSDDFLERACINRDEFNAYAKGQGVCGWGIENPKRWAEPERCGAYGVKPPQSWAYVKPCE